MCVEEGAHRSDPPNAPAWSEPAGAFFAHPCIRAHKSIFWPASAAFSGTAPLAAELHPWLRAVTNSPRPTFQPDGPAKRGGDDDAEVYFAVVGSDEGGLFTLLAGAGDRAGAADLRSAVTARLVAEWPPVMVRAFDDELELAEWAVRQWPNDPAATTIVATITAERRGG